MADSLVEYKTSDHIRNRWRKWYRKNQKDQIVKIYRNRTQRRISKQSYILSLKLKCVICGFDNPAALIFHHRDLRDKHKSIADLIRGDYSIGNILCEIEKCDVLCANCHMILHFQDRLIGRTSDFESGNRGSKPLPGAIGV